VSGLTFELLSELVGRLQGFPGYKSHQGQVC
jgi:hypothetical protein